MATGFELDLTIVWEAAKILVSIGSTLFVVHHNWKKDVTDKLGKFAEKLAVIDTEINNLKGFHELLMQKMVALMIHPETPDVDRLLIRIARGEDLNRDEWQYLHDHIQHMFEEAIRGKETDTQYALAFLLSWIESRRKERNDT